jgi:hypothetical protein
MVGHDQSAPVDRLAAPVPGPNTLGFCLWPHLVV